MAITKEMIQDKIEVVGPFKIGQVRTTTILKEDGVELTRTYKRKSIAPGDDSSSESDDVKGVINIFHTDEVKAAYKKAVDEAEKI